MVSCRCRNCLMPSKIFDFPYLSFCVADFFMLLANMFYCILSSPWISAVSCMFVYFSIDALWEVNQARVAFSTKSMASIPSLGLQEASKLSPLYVVLQAAAGHCMTATSPAYTRTWIQHVQRLLQWGKKTVNQVQGTKFSDLSATILN